MKTSFRKVLSLATASALALSMAIVGSAAEGDTLTRGEMAKLLVEGAGLSDQVAQYQAQESVFQDVAEDSEYKAPRAWSAVPAETPSAPTPRPPR